MKANAQLLFTQSRLAEQKIAKQNNIIERMLESSNEAIVMCDSEGKAVLANGRFEQLFGRASHWLIALCLLRGDESAVWHAGENGFMRTSRCSGPSSFRERVSLGLAEGETRHYECFASPIASEDGDMLHGHLFTFGDRTDEERKANYDELTGLPNRRYTHERIRLVLDRAQQTGTACSIFFMDLDGFKKVNDTLGHEMGDRLLQEVAVILRGCVGNQGISARWAGDEFVVLIENADDSEQLEDTARAIIRTIRQTGRHRWSTGIRVGEYWDCCLSGGWNGGNAAPGTAVRLCMKRRQEGRTTTASPRGHMNHGLSNAVAIDKERVVHIVLKRRVGLLLRMRLEPNNPLLDFIFLNQFIFKLLGYLLV